MTVILFALCGLLAAPSEPIAAEERAREAILSQLRRVPPVAWLDGYWVTPVDLSLLAAPGSGREDDEPRRLPPLGLAFTAGSLREAVALPFVGEFPRFDSVAASMQGVFVVPTADPENALIEYLPPPPPSVGEDPCYYFCGDPATWDFDSDGETNASDPDDDDDGVADDRDDFPYWPGSSECDCGEHAFVGFSGKFSPAVSAAVVAAFTALGQGKEPVRLGSAGTQSTDVWLVLPDVGSHPPPAGCPDPEAPGVRYVSSSPEECSRLRFRCEPGRVPFSNECGCGCGPDESTKP